MRDARSERARRAWRCTSSLIAIIAATTGPLSRVQAQVQAWCSPLVVFFSRPVPVTSVVDAIVTFFFKFPLRVFARAGVGSAEDRVQFLVVRSLDIELEQQGFHVGQVLGGFLEEDLIELAQVEIGAR